MSGDLLGKHSGSNSRNGVETHFKGSGVMMTYRKKREDVS